MHSDFTSGIALVDVNGKCSSLPLAVGGTDEQPIDNQGRLSASIWATVII